MHISRKNRIFLHKNHTKMFEDHGKMEQATHFWSPAMITPAIIPEILFGQPLLLPPLQLIRPFYAPMGGMQIRGLFYIPFGSPWLYSFVGRAFPGDI